MNIDDLVKAFIAARDDKFPLGTITPKTTPEERIERMKSSLQAGVKAVVAALRDEMGQSLAEVAVQECCGRGTATRYSEQTECCDCPDLLVTTEQVSKAFNDILGDAVEKAGEMEGSHYTFCSHPAADPSQCE